MSGGVGPTYNDITLPKEEEEEETEPQPQPQHEQQHSKLQRKPGLLTFRQLNALAVIVVLSASGMISPEDLAFFLFSIAYMYLLSKIAFPLPQSPSIQDTQIFDPNNKVLKLYVLVGAIIGLLLPIAYIFQGIFEGDKEGMKAASPHVFLLGSQVFMEGVAFSGQFSIPVRVFVPVFYNSRRIFTIVEWLRSEFSKGDGEYATRLYVGRALALANMGFWCFNLFGFLLPVYLPKAFKKYYSTIKD
ncbi:hypothetical protein ACFE04_027121 [Oxalis oulophora]